MGANVFSRPQTQHDAIRFFSQLRRLQFDLARRWQTPGIVLEFSDTEEVNLSHPPVGNDGITVDRPIWP
jgi:hypothetical protein